MRSGRKFCRVNRPFPHYAPVSKHKEMKTRLGWTISYKSLYFVHPSLELVPLFTGMRERSIWHFYCLLKKKQMTLARAHNRDTVPLTWFFQVKFESKVTPKYLTVETSWMFTPSIFRFNDLYGLSLLEWKRTKLVFKILRASLLDFIHSATAWSSWFKISSRSLRFLS